MNQAAQPRVGLALGSGSARGWSHIGVIRALERLGVRPEVVAGTSVGAVVGAFYAAGRLDALERWVRSLNRANVLSMIDVTLRSTGGVMEGRRLSKFYTDHLGKVCVENLKLDFGAVATRLERGTEVWLRDGPLDDALRASTALPGLLPPVRFGDDWLVDGGLVNPVPVSLCRAMGAEVVVAVNLNGDLVGRHTRGHTAITNGWADAEVWLRHLPNGLRERAKTLGGWWDGGGGEDGPVPPGLFEVIAGSLNIMQDRITRSRMAGDPPDLLIAPRLAHIGLLEFDRAEEAIAIGGRAVERISPYLQDLFSSADG